MNSATKTLLLKIEHELTTECGLVVTDKPGEYDEALRSGCDSNGARDCQAAVSWKLDHSDLLAEIRATIEAAVQPPREDAQSVKVTPAETFSGGPDSYPSVQPPRATGGHDFGCYLDTDHEGPCAPDPLDGDPSESFLLAVQPPADRSEKFEDTYNWELPPLQETTVLVSAVPAEPPADREPTDAVDFKSGEVDVEALRKSAAPADEQEFNEKLTRFGSSYHGFVEGRIPSGEVAAARTEVMRLYREKGK